MITINGWWDSFENCDSRKRQRLGRFDSPSGCDSRGYRKLMRAGIEGVTALGVFQAICQSFATLCRDVRECGTFRHNDGTDMELDEILDLARLPAECEQSLTLLEEVGWIRLQNKGESANLPEPADDLPVACRKIPALYKSKPKPKHRSKPKPTQAPTAEMARIGKFFNRRETTAWSAKEIESLAEAKRGASPEDWEADVKTLEKYYLKVIPKELDYRRRDLQTLLNNWSSELDRARTFQP